MAKKDKKKKGFYIILMIIILIGVGGYWFFKTRSKEEGPTYKIAIVRKGDIMQSFSAEASVIYETYEPTFAINGVVTEIYVHKGQHVNKGDKIAKLDTSKLEKQVEIARYNFYKAIYERDKIDKEEQYESWAAAQQSVNQAKANLDIALLNLQDAVLKAPVSGEIADVLVEVGQNVSTNTPVVKIRTGKINIVSKLDDIQVLNVKPGMKVYLTADTVDKKIPAKVTYVSKIATVDQSGWNSYEVYIMLVDSKYYSKLLDGMTLDADFVSKEVKNVLYIPVDAIYRVNGKAYVKKQNNDGSIVEQEVVPGFTNGKVVQIQEGLDVGDKVVIEVNEKTK